MSPNPDYSKSSGSSMGIGGAVAGIVAGIAMGLSVSIYSALGTGGWSLPWQMIAAMYYGPMAFVGGAGVTTIGVLTHMFVAAALGVIFAGLTPWVRSVGLSFILGIIYSIAVWAFMTYVTLVVLNETMLARVAIHPTWWFFVHWTYGGILGLIMPAMRPRRARRVQAPVEEREHERATATAGASTPR